jgi:uncharacterized protein (DUF983 family)
MAAYARVVSIPPARFGVMMRRGLTGRCAWCGVLLPFSRRWLGKRERCRRCGLRWRREEGFELGATTVNMIMSMVAVLAVFIVGMVMRGGSGAVWPVAVAAVVVGFLVPVLIYPVAYTTWQAVDLRGEPPTESEIAEARSMVVSVAVSASPDNA